MAYTYPKIICYLSKIKIQLVICIYLAALRPTYMSGELVIILSDSNQASPPPGSLP